MGRATNYSNCYIYHIVDSDKVVHYVGSTSNFNSRKSKHKWNCTHEHCKEYNLDIYKYIRENGGFDNFEIIPIRKIDNVSNKTELRIAEREEMEKYTGLKNMRGSYATKEEKLQLIRVWQENNSEKYLGKIRQWRQANPAKVVEIHRKYYEANSEKILERKRQRYHEKKQLKAEDQ